MSPGPVGCAWDGSTRPRTGLKPSDRLPWSVEVFTMTKAVTALGAPRLSKDADESTSMERQKTGMEGWAAYRSSATTDNYRMIYPEILDTDISGAMSPFDRPGLGPYLRKPLLDTWQVLVVYRLDRLTRSIRDFENLWKFLEANKKTLVSVAEQIDFGTPHGRLMARQLVLFAEYEREMIKARTKNAYDTTKQKGRYPGGWFPFGFWPAQLPSGGWVLDHHDYYADILRDVVDRLLAGESLSALCRWLNAEGIPTSRNIVRQYGNERRIQEGRTPNPIPEAKWDTTSLTAIRKTPP
jgi:site-specific DNA recombinase